MIYKPLEKLNMLILNSDNPTFPSHIL